MGGLLRPAACVAAMWNRYQHAPSISAEFLEVHERLAPQLTHDSVPLGTMPPARALCDVGAIAACRLFETSTEHDYSWERRYTRDQWLAVLETHSRHRGLPVETRDGVLSEIGEVVERHGGEIVVRMRTEVVVAVRCEQSEQSADDVPPA